MPIIKGFLFVLIIGGLAQLTEGGGVVLHTLIALSALVALAFE